jgi:hypothetical protein
VGCKGTISGAVAQTYQIEKLQAVSKREKFKEYF